VVGSLFFFLIENVGVLIVMLIFFSLS